MFSTQEHTEKSKKKRDDNGSIEVAKTLYPKSDDQFTVNCIAEGKKTYTCFRNRTSIQKETTYEQPNRKNAKEKYSHQWLKLCRKNPAGSKSSRHSE